MEIGKRNVIIMIEDRDVGRKQAIRKEEEGRRRRVRSERECQKKSREEWKKNE